MNVAIKEMVTSCSVCAEFQAKNTDQTMQTHQVPNRPWSKVGTDLFTVSGKTFIIIVVDYYSDFVEIDELSDTMSDTVIQVLKKQFSRHGIPDTVVSDNGSQFTSQEFHEFSLEWEFNVTSSPHYPKSNGKAESSVKVVKQLFKKAYRDGKDPWLALLDNRNTPTEGLDTSPAQRLMSRRTRTLLPTASGLLYPEVAQVTEEKIKAKREKAKYYYDRTAKKLPELEIGQEVRIAPLKRHHPWKSGTCVEKLSDRSYLVETGSFSLRRNRQALKPHPHQPCMLNTLTVQDRNHKQKDQRYHLMQLQKFPSFRKCCG